MNTRTIEILLEIMADTEMSTRRRIEAAEALLGFEARPKPLVVRGTTSCQSLKIARRRSAIEWMH
jgi:hypothetical protein